MGVSAEEVVSSNLSDQPQDGVWGHSGNKGLPTPTMEREVSFLSAELKAYQEQTLKLAKLLQEAKTKLEALQNENSFLKSELEVMHQCSNDADERLDTLRRHFSERIREMERRYAEKERVWKETFGRLRSHLDLGAMDVDPSAVGLGPEFAMGRRGRPTGAQPGIPEPPLGVDTLTAAALGAAAALGEVAVDDSEGVLVPGEGSIGRAADGTILPPGRIAPAGRVSLWPGGQT